MELIDNLALGLGVALTPANLGFAFIGAMVGTLIGVLPGIGPIATRSAEKHKSHCLAIHQPNLAENVI